MEIGLSYNDILLVPRRSAIVSRKDVSLKTKFSQHIDLNMPIISANMDTVTESKMAAVMAEQGGLGIIHRFMTSEEQVREVQKVKRLESFTVEVPYTLTSDKTLRDAKRTMAMCGVSGLLIVDKKGKLEGILTRRDILFETDEKKKVKQLMTPKPRLITALAGISSAEAKKILHKNKIEKLPLVDKKGNLCGLITSKDILRASEFPNAAKDSRGRLRVGAAIGVKGDFLRRARALFDANVDALVVDIAHGHSENTFKTIRALRKEFGSKIEIVAGNVATPQAVIDLIRAGVNAIKVGVGPGSICTTRITAGVGVPQFSAILNCAKAAQGKVPIIADGGIRYPGDITKALSAGASSVMIGNLLAGTDESPGMTLMRDGRKYKFSRGMASFAARLSQKYHTGGEEALDDLKDYVAEGVEAMVPYRGNASEAIAQLLGGLRSGMSYCNTKTIIELQKNAEFVRITPSGWEESLPHDVEVL